MINRMRWIRFCILVFLLCFCIWISFRLNDFRYDVLNVVYLVLVLVCLLCSFSVCQVGQLISIMKNCCCGCLLLLSWNEMAAPIYTFFNTDCYLLLNSSVFFFFSIFCYPWKTRRNYDWVCFCCCLF